MGANYFEWSQPMSDDPREIDWSIDVPGWAWVEMPMRDGRRLNSWNPSLTATYTPYGNPMDFREDIYWHIYSACLRQLVANEAPDAVQYLPFRLRCSVGSSDITGYCVANYLRIVDCLDRERTVLRSATWEPVNSLGDFALGRVVLSRRLIGKEKLFRVKGESGLVVVRGDLKDAIESAGMTGCLFTNVDVSG